MREQWMWSWEEEVNGGRLRGKERVTRGWGGRVNPVDRYPKGKSRVGGGSRALGPSSLPFPWGSRRLARLLVFSSPTVSSTVVELRGKMDSYISFPAAAPSAHTAGQAVRFSKRAPCRMPTRTRTRTHTRARAHGHAHMNTRTRGVPIVRTT